MKHIWKHIGISLVMVLVLAGVFVGMGTLTAMIPRSAIEGNIRASMAYLPDDEVRTFLVEGEHSTVIDTYADAVILNLAWHNDANQPLRSYMTAMYRLGDDARQSKTLRASVLENATPNDSYSRYWHGMLVLVRPLLAVTDLLGIRIINAIVLIALAGVLIWQLVRRKLYSLLWGYVAASVALYCFMVPLCMEYMAPFLLFHLFSILLLLWDETLEPYTVHLFLLFGALTCYFDFLTTETLVFVVPMLVILCLRGRDGRLATFRQAFGTTALCGVHWLCGYLVFFPIKWILTSLVEGRNTFAASLSHALARTGEVEQYAGISPLDSLVSNIGRVFPFTLLSDGLLIWYTALFTIAAIAVVWCILRVRKQQGKLPGFAPVLLLLMLLPYVRFFVLKNHSIVHSFMVFRAQLGAFMALFAFFDVTIQRKRDAISQPRAAQRSAHEGRHK